LIGKVIRLHSKITPEKVKLYLITDENTSFSQGKVNIETVKEWIKNGDLELDFYSK